MKKSIAIILVFCFIISFFTACNKSDTGTSSEIEQTPNNIIGENVQVDLEAFEDGTIVTADVIADNTINELFSGAKKTVIYELLASLDNKASQPKDVVKVGFPLPEEYDSEKHDITVFFVDVDNKAEQLKTNIIENRIEVELTHFSKYAVVLVDKGILDSIISKFNENTSSDGNKKTETTSQNSDKTTTYSNKTNGTSNNSSTNNSKTENKQPATNSTKPNTGGYDFTNYSSVNIGNMTIRQLPWDKDGYGIKYVLEFDVTTSTVKNINIGNNLRTVNTDDPILQDRGCTISIDDGRVFSPSYKDYYAGWSESRKEMSRGITTCGSFLQDIPEGISAGRHVKIEVWQRGTTSSDQLEPQILLADIVDPGAGYPLCHVYGRVVYVDGSGEKYTDNPFPAKTR